MNNNRRDHLFVFRCVKSKTVTSASSSRQKRKRIFTCGESLTAVECNLKHSELLLDLHYRKYKSQRVSDILFCKHDKRKTLLMFMLLLFFSAGCVFPLSF